MLRLTLKILGELRITSSAYLIFKRKHKRLTGHKRSILAAGNTMQALIEARDIEIAAELKMPIDKITNEDRKKFSEEKGDYGDYETAAINYANTYQALVANSNINNAAASGERILVKSTKDPQVAKMLADSGLEAQGDFIAVRNARGEDGSWKPVGLVTNSDGGVAISDNAYDIYDSAVVAGSGIGLSSELQRKTLAANAMKNAEEISRQQAAGDITATQAIEQANQTIALLEGNAAAIQQQLQEQADKANGQLAVADEAIYKARLNEATNPNLINIAAPAGLPAADVGLANRLNTLDSFAGGEAPTAFSYNDPSIGKDRLAARTLAEKRRLYGAAFTGREGEVDTFLSHQNALKLKDNNARQAENERTAGAKTDVDSLDFNKNATGTAARYVKPLC